MRKKLRDIKWAWYRAERQPLHQRRKNPLIWAAFIGSILLMIGAIALIVFLGYSAGVAFDEGRTTSGIIYATGAIFSLYILLSRG